jgi:hypothetical protein
MLQLLFELGTLAFANSPVAGYAVPDDTVATEEDLLWIFLATRCAWRFGFEQPRERTPNEAWEVE